MPEAAEDVHEEEQREHHLGDLEHLQIDLERRLERGDVLVELEQLEQPQHAHEPQPAEHLELARVRRASAVAARVLGEGEQDELDGDRRGQVDPEPPRQVARRDVLARDDPALVVEVRRVEGRDQVGDENEGHDDLRARAGA